MARPPITRMQVRLDPRVQAIGLTIASVVSAFAVREAYRANVALPVAASELADAPTGRKVELACSAELVEPGWRIADPDDPSDAADVYLCPIDPAAARGGSGAHAVVVVADRPVRELDRAALSGRWCEAQPGEPWSESLRNSRIDAVSDRYLDLTSNTEDRVLAAISAALALGTVAGWMMFVRRRRNLRIERQAH